MNERVCGGKELMRKGEGMVGKYEGERKRGKVKGADEKMNEKMYLGKGTVGKIKSARE